MRQTLQRVVPAAALALVAAAGAAQAAVEVCNGFKDAAITVAMARNETGRIHIRGWYTVEVGKCLRLDAAASSVGRHSFLARHEETKVVSLSLWRRLACVHPSRAAQKRAATSG